MSTIKPVSTFSLIFLNVYYILVIMVKMQRRKKNSFMPFVLEILKWKSVTMKMVNDDKG